MVTRAVALMPLPAMSHASNTSSINSPADSSISRLAANTVSLTMALAVVPIHWVITTLVARAVALTLLSAMSHASDKGKETATTADAPADHGDGVNAQAVDESLNIDSGGHTGGSATGHDERSHQQQHHQ